MSRKIIFLYHIESINIGLQAYSGITARVNFKTIQQQRTVRLQRGENGDHIAHEFLQV